MKKIFLLALTGATLFQVNAQNAPGTTNVKVMTVAEVNALNGTANPTINGKPYSQFKAEQDALKQQSPAAKMISQHYISPMGATENYVKPAEATKPAGARDLKETAVAPASNLTVKKDAQTEKPAATSVNTTVHSGPGTYADASRNAQRPAVTQDPSDKQSPSNNTVVPEKPRTEGLNGTPLPAKQQ